MNIHQDASIYTAYIFTEFASVIFSLGPGLLLNIL